MQFIDNAPLYRIVRTTGPTHNMLGLEFFDDDTMAAPIIEILDAGKETPRLQADAVAAAVARGLEVAAAETGRHRQIRRIQFLASDSPPVEVYTMLTQEILRRIAS